MAAIQAALFRHIQKATSQPIVQQQQSTATNVVEQPPAMINDRTDAAGTRNRKNKWDHERSIGVIREGT